MSIFLISVAVFELWACLWLKVRNTIESCKVCNLRNSARNEKLLLTTFVVNFISYNLNHEQLFDKCYGFWATEKFTGVLISFRIISRPSTISNLPPPVQQMISDDSVPRTPFIIHSVFSHSLCVRNAVLCWTFRDNFPANPCWNLLKNLPKVKVTTR